VDLGRPRTEAASCLLESWQIISRNPVRVISLFDHPRILFVGGIPETQGLTCQDEKKMLGNLVYNARSSEKEV